MIVRKEMMTFCARHGISLLVQPGCMHKQSFHMREQVYWAQGLFLKTHLYDTFVSTPDLNSSAESKKGITLVQRCSIQNQKGAITRLCTAIVPFWLEGRYRQSLYSNCALLVLNGTSLNSINALLALSRQIDEISSAGGFLY